MANDLENNKESTYGTTSIEINESNTYKKNNKSKIYFGCLVFIFVIGAIIVFRSENSINANVSTYLNNNDIKVIETSVDSDYRLKDVSSERLNTNQLDDLYSDNLISIDPSVKYQEIFGFGGAFTEAASIQFKELSKELQEKVIDLYFDSDKGIGYTFGRMHINSCDFSVKSYNFDDVPDDRSLSHFDKNVSHDQETIIPFIKEALKKQPKLNLFASPWSPPSWMKLAINGKQNMTGSAMPNGLDPIYQSTWAKYISLFISAYEDLGIPVWGITVQNEPGFAAPWEACAYTPEYMRDFVRDHLGPILSKDHPKVKIMFFDHNRDGVFGWAKALYEDSEAASYISGIAFHWYASSDRLLDGMLNYNSLQQAHELNPQKFLFATESCNCPNIASGKQSWWRGQRYAHDILNDLRNHARGWIDWNLLLNENGGPNHLGNECDAPIWTSENGKKLNIQPMYYFLGHFSKYIPPGSKRIDSNVQVRFHKPGKPDLHNGYPGGTWFCDHSSRQRWNITENLLLKIENTEFCTTNTDGVNVQFWKCWDTNTQRWTFEDGKIININDKKCLYVDDSISSEDPGTLKVQDCSKMNGNTWIYSKKDKSLSYGNKCMTAGYAFLQSVAFLTPDDQKVLVVLNENSEKAHFQILDGDKTIQTSISANSIQTYLW